MTPSELWRDVRTGKNVDLWLALTTSVVAFLLSIFGLTNVAVTLSLALVLLGLIANSLLRSRSQAGRIERALHDLEKTRGLSDRMIVPEEDIHNDVVAPLRASKEAFFWGTTLTSHVPFLLPELEKAITRGANVRVLLIKGTGSAMTMAGFRAGLNSVDGMSRDLANTLHQLRDLSARGGNGAIAVRLVDYLPPYVLYCFDPRGGTGRAMVRLGGFRADQAERPTIFLDGKADRYWFEYFVREFEKVWQAASTPPFGEIVL